jgi:hypothetical protein
MHDEKGIDDGIATGGRKGRMNGGKQAMNGGAK